MIKNLPLLFAIACFVVALLIFLFGSGLKVIYSGGFFILLGIILLLNAKRKDKNPADES
jgi:hypothetical protein